MTKYFFIYYKKKIKRYFEKNTKARVGVALTMLIMIGLLMLGVYFLAVEGLIATQTGADPFIIKAMPLYMYELFFLIVGFLVFVSTVIFGLFSFFKGDKDNWIMASPYYESLAWVKFFRALIESSWPIIVIAFPLVAAVATVFPLSLFDILLTVVTITAFSFFCAAAAILLVFFLSLFLKRFRCLASLMMLIVFIFGILIWNRGVTTDINSIFQVKEAVTPLLLEMQGNFSIFPSHPVAMMTYYLQINNLSRGLLASSQVIVLFLILLMLFLLLKKKFLMIWQRFQEGNFEAKTKETKKKFKLFGNYFPTSAEDTIRKKELLVNFRSSKNIFWLAFLVFLMLIQVGVVNLLESYLGIGASQKLVTAGATPSLQIGVILFFISAIVLRFVFPSLSQEGNTSWIIGSVPLDLKKIFEAKYKFYSKLLLLISFISLGVYVIPLRVALEIVFLSVIVLFIATITLTMLGLGMGTIFINFETDDPQVLSTSAPGIIMVLASILYSGWAGYLLYSIAHSNYFSIVLFLIISIFIYLFIKVKALNTLDKLEFI